MRHLLIIGARGFGREVYTLYRQCKETLDDVECIGFLDDNAGALDGYEGYPPIISSPETYEIRENDVFVCALGDVAYKRRYAEMMMARGAKFISLIHPDARIGINTTIGEGSIIRMACSIDCDITIGRFVTIMAYASLGHDCRVGDWSHLGAHTFMGGFSEIQDLVTLHPGARVLPHKRVGSRAVVGAGSVVVRNVKPQTTVLGVPARPLEFA